MPETTAAESDHGTPTTLPAANGPARIHMWPVRLGSILAAVGVLIATMAASPADAPKGASQEFSKPEELLSSISRVLKPDWVAHFRQTVPKALDSRAQLAFAIGSVFAEGWLATHAEDTQHSRNIGKDLLLLAKPLGTHPELIEHSKSLADCAEKRNWELLKQELESAESDLTKALAKNGDPHLASLVQLGKWVRTLEIAAGILHHHYSDLSAGVLQQSLWEKSFYNVLVSAVEFIRLDAALSPTQPQLSDLHKLLKAQASSLPTDSQINSLSEAAHAVLIDILSNHN
jgi:hypothetical protein